jgi:SlyX protein
MAVRQETQDEGYDEVLRAARRLVHRSRRAPGRIAGAAGVTGRHQEAESRLDEVESRVTFQDDLIESLNRVVARQELELADLSRRLRALEGRFEGFVETAGGAPGHEVPPHY